MTKAERDDKGLPSTLALVASLLTHVLLLLPVLYIVGIAFEAYDGLFVWHPICMALGAGLLIMEAVYAISGEAFASKKLGRQNRITLHWVLHLVGLALLLVGLVIVIVNKNNKGKEHFVTPHSQLGLATLVITGCVAFFGIFANNAQWLYPRLRPILLKVLHSFGGIAATILLLATVITGTYGKWWTKIGASETGRELVFASLFIAGVFVLIKPVIGAVARSRVLARPPPGAVQTAGNST